MQERCVEHWGLQEQVKSCRKDMFSGWAFEDAGVKKPSFSLFNTTKRELQRVSCQIEVTSKLKKPLKLQYCLRHACIHKGPEGINKESKAFQRDFNRDPKGIRRDSEAFITDFTSIPKEFIWIPGP